MTPHPTDWRSIREPMARVRAGAIAVPLLAVMLVIGGAAFAGIQYSTVTSSRTRLASDGATILALEGLHAFSRAADSQTLMSLPVGADSMVMAARVFGGHESMGTYAVSLKRSESEGFRLLATGRLVAGKRSMICSVHGRVRFANPSGEEISVGYDSVPLCNGTRYRSALTTQPGS